MRAVLDTNVLLLGLRLPEEYADLKASALTWREIRRGIGMYRGNGDSATALRFESHSNALRQALGAGLPFDDSCAATFQSVVELTDSAGRESKGRVIDLMIAATAIVHQADLLTHNPGDFAGLGSLLNVVEV